MPSSSTVSGPPRPAGLPRLPGLPGLPPVVRAAALEALVLAGHLLLYPTGVRAEQLGPAPEPHAPPPGTATDTGAAIGAGAGTATGAGTGTAPGAPALLPTEGRSPRPVVLLHGFADNRSVYVLMRRALLRHGWPHVYALNHSLLTRDIRTAAESLGRQIEEIRARTGHRQVDLVGHSLGGLTARYYVQRLGGDAYVRTVVTLGTPHSGTRAVPALPTHPIAHQMRPGSALLRELADPCPEGCETRFVSFWSDWDALMIPRETARLDHPDLHIRNIPWHGVGHLALPVDCAVSARVRAELRAVGQASLAPPDSSPGVA